MIFDILSMIFSFPGILLMLVTTCGCLRCNNELVAIYSDIMSHGS